MVSSEIIGDRFERLVLVKMNIFEFLTKSRCSTSRKYVLNGFLVKTCVNSIKPPNLRNRLNWYPQNRIVRNKNTFEWQKEEYSSGLMSQNLNRVK